MLFIILNILSLICILDFIVYIYYNFNCFTLDLYFRLYYIHRFFFGQNLCRIFIWSKLGQDLFFFVNILDRMCPPKNLDRNLFFLVNNLDRILNWNIWAKTGQNPIRGWRHQHGPVDVAGT